MNIERLRNVARALREAPIPEAFDMDRYTWRSDQPTMSRITCGMPACAFGHYASRTDLQDFVVIKPPRFLEFTGTEKLAGHNDPETCEHFSINELEANFLFASVTGAEKIMMFNQELTEDDFLAFNANTNLEAANWIDVWIDRHTAQAKQATP